MFHLWPAWDTDIVLDLPCTPADLARVIEDEAPEWAPLPDNAPNVWRWRIDGARQTVWRAPGCGWLQALATSDGARLEVFLPHVLVYPYGATIARRAWSALSERLIDLGWLVEDEEDEEPVATQDEDKGSDIAARRRKVRELWGTRPDMETKEAFKRRVAPELAMSESTIRDDLRYLEGKDEL